MAFGETEAIDTLGALAASLPAGWAASIVVSRYAQPAPPTATRLVVGAMAVVFAWAAIVAPTRAVLLPSLGLGWTLVTLTFVDLACYRLPDPLTLPLTAAGLLLSFMLPDTPVIQHLAGAAAGYGMLAAMGWLYERLRGREGIGLGDAKLLGAAGAWLGWQALPSVLLAACAAAFLWVAARALARRTPALGDRLAFGGPLCIAIWLVWLYGPLTV